MGAWELVVTAIGLSMDAFAVAVCKGLSLRNLRWRQCAVVGLYCISIYLYNNCDTNRKTDYINCGK